MKDRRKQLRRSTGALIGHVIVEDHCEVWQCYKRHDMFSYYRHRGTITDWVRDRHYKFASDSSSKGQNSTV